MQVQASTAVPEPLAFRLGAEENRTMTTTPTCSPGATPHDDRIDLAAWASRFGTSVHELIAAVEAVGNDAEAVRAYLAQVNDLHDDLKSAPEAPK